MSNSLGIFQQRLGIFCIGLALSLANINVANADDTEVFYAGSTTKPNVLLVLDTSGSMGWRIDSSKHYDAVTNPLRINEMKKALIQLIAESKDMNIGLARFNGYASSILVPVTPLDEPMASRSNKLGRDILTEAINEIRVGGGTPAVGAIYEALLYFRGNAIDMAKQRGSSTDRVASYDSYINGIHTLPNNCSIDNLSSWDCRYDRISDAPGEVATYISPIDVSCESDNNIILLTDGSASTDMDDEKVKTLTGISSCQGSGAEECGIDLATFMSTTDQRRGLSGNQFVKLHTIGFAHEDTWLEDLATKGNGSYKTATVANELAGQFKAIFGDILEANSTYTSAGISINSSNRLNHNEEVYFSLFKPSPKVRWAGNLKKYKIGSSGQILDKNNLNAMDPDTGYFSTTSQGFWSTTPDGAEVFEGGAANLLKGNNRVVYSNLVGNDLSTLTQQTLIDTPNLLNLNNFGATSSGDATQDANLLKKLVRFTRSQRQKSPHASNHRISDPLHSKPYIMTYQETVVSEGISGTVNSAVVYFGDNQGLLHAIDSDSGQELWSFIPKELLKNQNKLRNNPQHQNNHVYGLDGNASAWINNNHKYLYIGMRRGGSSYYALDVTNKNSPTLKWKLSRSTDSSSPWHELGQTWSKPIKTKVRISDNSGVSTRDVLIFAGGYDPQQDTTTVRTADSHGRAIYIIDAATGDVLWMGSHAANTVADANFSEMNYSIPSEIKVIDTNSNGIADQMFVGDMGGQVWRFSMNEASGTVSGGVIARFGGTTTQSNQRFYHPPDISLTPDGKMALAMGSGYHANPLNTVIHDRFYLLTLPQEPPSVISLSITLSNLLDVTGSSNSSVNVVQSDLQAKKGWYINLRTKGEKVLAPSLTANGVVWFTTFEPSQQSRNCIVTPGTSYLYRVKVSDATPVYKKTIPDDTDNTSTMECKANNCLKEDRRMLLKTGTLPPDPIILRVEGKKLIGVGAEIMEFGNTRAKSMYWTEK